MSRLASGDLNRLSGEGGGRGDILMAQMKRQAARRCRSLDKGGVFIGCRAAQLMIEVADHQREPVVKSGEDVEQCDRVGSARNGNDHANGKNGARAVQAQGLVQRAPRQQRKPLQGRGHELFAGRDGRGLAAGAPEVTLFPRHDERYGVEDR